MTSSAHHQTTYAGLPVYRLVDVLGLVPLPPNCPLTGVSSKWRCVLAPKIKSSGDDETAMALTYFEAGIPCRLSRDRSAPVHKECGDDAFAFVNDPRWNQFPKPKIAFKAGWAGPGTQMESEAYHKLIRSFKEVVDHVEGVKVVVEDTSTAATGAAAPLDTSDAADHRDDVQPEEILNLQMFHRSDPNIDPLIPVLSEKLEWLDALQDGAICDNATRVSQRGAITWWHLDDSGEFVMQTGLPLQPKPEHVFGRAPATSLEREIYNNLYCVDESPNAVPTKLFVYGPSNSYDWFSHDDESDVSGKIAALNIFDCSDDDLPQDESLLPILCVAVLESGGRPLISPPNIPHAVFSVNNCVMVEQRRVCNLFLEEVAYFLEKCKHWQSHPIIYSYVEESLRNENVLRDELIPTLLATFHVHDDDSKVLDVIIRKRVAAAIYTLHKFPEYFVLPEDSRRSLKGLIDEKMQPYLNRMAEGEKKPAWSLQRRLDDHWQVKAKYWPKPGCVFAPPRTAGTPADANPVPRVFLPVVYRKGLPVYGCAKPSAEETAKEYHQMARLLEVDKTADWKTNALAKYVATAKHPVKDDLLDELF